MQSKKNIEKERKAYGELLGLEEPVSNAVIMAALDDESYARALIQNKENKEELERLLNNPPITVHEVTDDFIHSHFQLIKSATRSLLRWSKGGFSTIDIETLEKRENACLSCPHLTGPKNILQKIIPGKIVPGEIGKRTGKMVCNKCGCNVSRKILLPTEFCPDEHPEMEGVNRWGE